jgi:superfamily I DNA/RNA helicase
MEKKNRTVIPGPPGTGKTYRLLNHYIKICYITFSKAAAEEATERFEELFPKEKLGYIGTMHALGVRELNIDVSAKLLRGNSQWNQFKLTRFKDPILTTRDYAKNKKISLNEAAIQKGMAGWSDIHIAEKIDGALTQYKKDTGVIEFYDMIGLFTDKIKTKDSFYDVIFLDEAQDLNALQWDMFFELEKLSNRSFIAGDDDQTIYGFQGADASTFINLEGTIDEQVKSRRVPRSVHRVALNILDRINERRTKNWEARDEEGEVNYETSLENIDFAKGKWMILGRTNKLCEKARDHLYMKGLRYEFTGDKYLIKILC